jgi:hypothetical protein
MCDQANVARETVHEHRGCVMHYSCKSNSVVSAGIPIAKRVISESITNNVDSIINMLVLVSQKASAGEYAKLSM